MATFQTEPTKFATANGTTIAYRLFGAPSTPTKPPLVFFQHFRGTMNHWDALLLAPLSLTRPILLLDYVGVGSSPGTVHDNFLSSAEDVITLLTSLNIKTIDLLGFSIGGFVAQLVTLEAPSLVRKLILAGTGPSAGEGLESGPQELFMDFVNAATMEENERIYLRSFFTGGERKQERGREWWERIHGNEREGDGGYLESEGTKMQVEAVVKWVSGKGTDGNEVVDGEKSYERLGEIKCPVLVLAGKEDQVVPVANAVALWKLIKQARLCVFEDVGHGLLIDYVDEVVKNIEMFLGS
jgi:pimeloyl-ACP methyl ester carboxylesterase